MLCLFTWTDEGLYFYSKQSSGQWEFNRLNFSPVAFEIVLYKGFCFAFRDHRIHIKKHGSVVECYVHVCWYTVL